MKNWLIVFLLFCINASAQRGGINWTADGLGYTKFKDGGIVKIDPKTDAETVLIKSEQLTPAGQPTLHVQSYAYSMDKSHVLLFANTVKVWRYKTRGDYWVLNTANGQLTQLGKTLPSQSLMFAKFSPDSKLVAYVSEHNLFVENIATGQIRKLTTDGTRKLINGTFDWAYEEEFGCRDGFRWSPDSKQIAFWQIDATKIRDYYMLNTTDSAYSRIIPVEYPKVGESPSPAKIGVANLNSGFVRWMNIEGDPQQHYIPRMDWVGNNELIVQQLDRKQQESRLIYCNAANGSSYTFWADNDDAWVDLNSSDIFGEPGGWDWINKGKEFLWISEKDGWRHIYKISSDGKTTTLITKGNYDIDAIKAVDEANNYIYFTASPNNATQLYLYRVRINNTKDEPELLSDANLKGMHQYDISPTAKMAFHSFSNHNTEPAGEWLTLPDNRPVNKQKSIANNLKTDPAVNVEYCTITTDDNIVLDAWIRKPDNFDSTKKYPIVFYVYGEPASSTVNDRYGGQNNFLYKGNMSADGYIQAAIDNRGTPSLKGAAWRKAIYRKIGRINIRDMAMGAKKILERNYIDKDRVAVWGWSGGGSSTLNLMFNYPEIFKTGIAIAAVANQLFYDNIYQERYMGLPQENLQDFVEGSPISHAQGLKGNLLYIHGSGDDNVQYDNAESLLNALIKYNKQFEFMEYPNRTHSISEGEGTWLHLSTLYTNFLRKNCPPGAK
ncbi:MAG: DPP IV N-terminal domain-containing protein [Bacteroidetes bacterium]|nr:DPP IV N-terminal domain-containing protein [Bacteroidota bacterium]MBS1757009.1 DPP IV N-terminal domain-containing protein [Bacteroidota bacterium]